MKTQQDRENGTIKSYLYGFFTCVLLTISAYYIVVEKWLTGWPAAIAITGLALIQTVVQLILFLHLGSELKPRWNLLIFFFMLLVLFILVFGSIWIMFNLNYQMMDM